MSPKKSIRRPELQTQVLLDQIVETVSEGIVATNQKGEFVFWNKAGGEILGLGMAELSPQE